MQLEQRPPSLRQCSYGLKPRKFSGNVADKAIPQLGPNINQVVHPKLESFWLNRKLCEFVIVEELPIGTEEARK
ncbi:UNVERIFIED_CONTAM: hypothetical protein Sangu_0538100 [Sesamum angustifolium]|uniref:Uncharacterized protein n=1 Tax=Sesamum angustifolium TaxID=2727405 RepID=A0AAW2QA59_9LAMI